MKVLYAINGLGTGGAERSLAEMLPYYEAAGIGATLAVMHARREGVESHVQSRGADMRYLPGNTSSRIRALRQLITSERPDLVHTTIFESDIVGRIAAAGTGVPVLTSLVNTSYDAVRLQDPNVRAWKLRGAQLIDGWTSRHLTAHFHAITHAVKSSAEQALGIEAERITVIERGRDPRRLGEPSPARRTAARAKLGLPRHAEILVTVGRQEFQKGHRYLLEAMDAIAARRPNAVLLVAGRTGNATDELQRLHQQLRFRDRVVFLGHRDDVPEVLAAADAFVFPSLYEGLGGAVIEAMALGLPVVASDVPAIREVVEEGRNALLVPAGSSAVIAEAVDRLLSNSDVRSAYAVRSRERFEDLFTLERSAARMIELYRRVAAQDATPMGEESPRPTANGKVPAKT